MGNWNDDVFLRFVHRIHGGLRQRHRDDQRSHRWTADSVAIQGTTARAFVELVQTRAGRVGGAFICITFVFRIYFYFRMGDWTDVVFCVYRVPTDTPLTCALCRWRRGPSTTS